MDKTQHTPGPWRAFHANSSICVDAAEPIQRVEDLGEAMFVECFGLNREANARLIAAAPELLEALERVEARLTAVARAFYVVGTPKALREALSTWKEDIEPARAAIANVKGGE
jgi:hypothetical protein